jgi:hypothetical protein
MIRGITACITTSSVTHAGTRITPVIKHLLPLPHIPQISIIQYTDNNRQFINNGRRHFLNVHLHTAITRDGNYIFMGISKLRSNCGGKTVSHRSQAARCQHSLIFVNIKKLRCP